MVEAGIRVEHERKFLVHGEVSFPAGTIDLDIRQTYLADVEDTATRVRITRSASAGTVATVTTKIGSMPSRVEMTRPIPVSVAERLLRTTKDRNPNAIIRKRRRAFSVDGVAWVVDDFKDALAGLRLAEVETPKVDTPVRLPTWVGAEVTNDSRYENRRLWRRGYPGNQGLTLLLMGEHGVGKTTLAKQLAEHQGFFWYPHARPVKDMARALGASSHALYAPGSRGMAAPAPFGGSVRDLLISITAWGREHSPEFWHEHYLENKPEGHVVLDDVRHPSDLANFEAANAVTMHLVAGRRATTTTSTRLHVHRDDGLRWACALKRAWLVSSPVCVTPETLISTASRFVG